MYQFDPSFIFWGVFFFFLAIAITIITKEILEHYQEKKGKKIEKVGILKKKKVKEEDKRE